MVARSRSRVPRLRIGVLARLHHALINRSRVLQISTRVLVGSLRYPDDIGYLLLAGALTDLDAAWVDTLLLYQVCLRVHCALGCQVHRMTVLARAFHRRLLAIGVTDDDDLGIRIRLQTAGYVVQNGLGSVIYTPRSLQIRELDGVGLAARWRRRRYFDANRASAVASQVAGIRRGDGYGDRSSCGACGIQGR